MRKERFRKDQILALLKLHEAGKKITDLARETGISIATLYSWRSKYGANSMDAHRLKWLEEENRVLKQLVADLSLEREILRAALAKYGAAQQ